MEETQDVEFKLPETVVEKPAPKKYIIIFGSLVLIFLLIGVVYSYFSDRTTEYIQSNTVTGEGTLFLSLSPKDGESAQRVDSYFYDIAKNSLTKFYDPELSSMTIAPRSGGNNALVFTTLKRTSEDSIEPDSMITHYNKENGAISYFTNNSKGHLKQFPSWSEPLKGTLYMTPATQSSNPDDATVYFTSTDGTFKIRSGMYPQFLPDGIQYLVLHNDGIYLHSMSDSAAQTKVANAPDDLVSTSESFDISGDGTTLAWVEHSKNRVYLYDIRSLQDSGSEIRPYEKFAAEIILPTLSSNGSMLAGVHTDSVAGTQNILLYNIQTKQYGTLLNTNAYNPEVTIISDWTN